MDYFDTDVLIHSLINQNPYLHLTINDLIKQIIKAERFSISWLTVQELGFVLAKLDQPASFISSTLSNFISASPAGYGLVEFNRAVEIAKIVGFKNFNDCLHTAIAEQHCTDLYTCNTKDFKRIQPLTALNIHFL
jgi:predicted nucleic acid-binding protein